MTHRGKIQTLESFTEACRKVVLPELKKDYATLDRMAAIQNEARNQIDVSFKQCEKPEVGYAAIKEASLRIERRLDSFQKFKSEWEKEVKLLKGEMNSLQQRLTQIEKRLRAL
ncbi:MAG: hypothetical protein RMM98_09730 [Acidobacteriota bacterium]|nr:hypothetical protein [Blastocatellia bacterium]MDW8239883.1 hypothetical protein [Acidobacteriota bacterium]